MLDGGGLDEDMSRPSDEHENILPQLLQRPYLSKMRRAAKAVAWKNMADQIDTTGDKDEPANHQAKARFLIKSAELSSNTAPFLGEGFTKSRQIEAGASFAEKWRSQSEATPHEKYSTKAHHYYTAVAAEIGFSIFHAAEVRKSDMIRGSQLCFGDLKDVHNVDEATLKTSLKRRPMKDLFGEESQTAENSKPPTEQNWMQKSLLSTYKGPAITLYTTR